MKNLTLALQNIIKLCERRWWAVPLVGVIVAAIIVYLIGIAQSVWFDEAYSLTLAKSSVTQLIHLTSIDVHPPFYYLILKAWGTLLGWSDVSLRSLGALIAAGLVWAIALLVKQLFGVRAMIVTIPFVTLAPFLLRYDFELRMYALAAIIGVVATYVLVRATQSKKTQKKWWIIYAILIAVGMYTVYYIALLWIAHVVWLVLRARKNKQPIRKQPWFFAIIGSIVIFLPWLPVFFTQLTNGALAGISQAMTIDNIVGIVSFAFLYKPVWQLNALESITVVGVLVAIAWLIVVTRKESSIQHKSYLVLLALQLAVPIIVITVISLIKPFYVERYLLPVLPALYIAVGVMLSITAKRYPSKSIIIGLFLFIVLITGTIHLAVVGNYNFQRLQTPTVRQTAKAIGVCVDGQTILAADPYVYIEMSQYVNSNCIMKFYSIDNVQHGGYAPLSGSYYQVNSVMQLGSPRFVTYVYYGDAKLQPMSGYTITSTTNYGSLYIQTWHK
jgi:mannosyltransferase